MAKQQIVIKKKKNGDLVILNTETKEELFAIDFSTHTSTGFASVTDLKGGKSVSAQFSARFYKHASGSTEHYISCSKSE